MDNTPPTKLIDALSARARFGELMEKVDKENVRFLVSRRGKPKVVILSVKDYMENIIKEPDLLAQVQMNAEKAGMGDISEKEIQAEIEAFRKSSQPEK